MEETDISNPIQNTTLGSKTRQVQKDWGHSGLEIDMGKPEISVDWDQLLTSFFFHKIAAEELEHSISR